MKNILHPEAKAFLLFWNSCESRIYQLVYASKISENISDWEGESYYR